MARRRRVTLVLAVATVVLAGSPASASTALPRDVQHSIRTCYGSSPQVWLSFDDGGTAAEARRILDILDERNVRALFFPVGSWAEAHRSLVRRIEAAGHVVGDHTHDHVDLAKASDARARWQIEHGVRGNASPMPLLRPPYGGGAYGRRLEDLATAEGMRLCTWTVDTRDWTGATAAEIVGQVRHGDGRLPGVQPSGVVLMHLQGDHTVEALPRVIDTILGRGLRLHHLR